MSTSDFTGSLSEPILNRHYKHISLIAKLAIRSENGKEFRASGQGGSALILPPSMWSLSNLLPRHDHRCCHRWFFKLAINWFVGPPRGRNGLVRPNPRLEGGNEWRTPVAAARFDGCLWRETPVNWMGHLVFPYYSVMQFPIIHIMVTC